MTEDDAAEGTAKSKDDEFKAAAERLKPLLDALAPEEPEQPEPRPDVIDELYGAIHAEGVTDAAKQAIAAVDRYRSVMRWLVAAVAAVAAFVFGSTAFTEGNFDSLWVFAALGLAGVGVVFVLWAATMVFVPEDASLGELAQHVDEFLRTPPASPGLRQRVFRLLERGLWPPRAERRRLGAILRSDLQAHLGPGRQTVRDLIKHIGRRQNARQSAAKEVASTKRELETHRSTLEIFEKRIAAYEGLPSKIGDSTPAARRELEIQLVHLLAQAGYRRGRVDTVGDDLAEKRNTLDKFDIRLGMDMLHRDLLLYESAVSQLRGTFTLSRRLLVLGAFLTLIGTTWYIWLIKQNDEDDTPTTSPVRTGTLVVDATTAAADPFPHACVKPVPDTGGNGPDSVVMAVALYAEELPSLDDEFTVTVNAPDECVGEYTIPGGRGADDLALELGEVFNVPSLATNDEDTTDGDENAD